MCTMPNTGHQYQATWTYRMGGAENGTWRTMMPSQSGQQHLTRRQRPASQFYLAWKAAGFPDKKQFVSAYQTARNNNNGQQWQQGNFMAQQGTMMMPPQQPFAGMTNQYQNMGGQSQNLGWNIGRNF